MFASKDIFLKSSGGYQISRSLRFRSSVSAYLNRTLTTPTNNLKWTWSAWIKRGTLSVANVPFGAGDGSSNNFGNLQFTTSNTLQFAQINGGAYNVQMVTSPVFRDPAAWYHIQVVYDSANATSTDRVQIYVNGVRQSVTYSTGPFAQNTASKINSAIAHYISKLDYTTVYFDGYQTEVNFIDGQALTPSSFGETNAVTGVWQPKAYSGTYGTNGFYLNFSDNSNNTATTIGKDYSGNGNNWTPNNISVTAGVTYDSMLDVPTPYADGGNGRGNYAVMNPLSVVSPTTIANGNLDVTTGTTGGGGAFSTIAIPSSGKYYFEFLPTSATTVADNIRVGVSNSTVGSYVLYKSDGNKVVDGSTTSYGATFTTNDTIGCAIDVDGGTITFYKNNSSQGSITYATSSGNFFAYTQDGSGTVSVVASFNFGQRPFSYTPPTGFVALNTQNLPTPTISNGANYMAATLYTGTGATQSITNTVNGISLQPDLIWIKSRSNALSHKLVNSVVGIQKALSSDSTAAESSDTGGVTAFNSNGFTIGTTLAYNTSAATYVGWQWNAGGSTVTNTSGSISSQVRANPTAGFSVVTYTGTAANATVGHGLGVAPSMIITKNRDSATAWHVFHTSLGATQYIVLNTTAAAVTSSASGWNNTSPTSSVFSLGASNPSNANQDVAYCFAAVAGYSAFGSYTGNGSADGPFVFTNFQPRWVMVKRTDAVDNWAIFDTSRLGYNADNNELLANTSSAEGTADFIDILSNGFKNRNSDSRCNASGGTYIFAAFAEVPFRYANAR